MEAPAKSVSIKAGLYVKVRLLPGVGKIRLTYRARPPPTGFQYN